MTDSAPTVAGLEQAGVPGDECDKARLALKRYNDESSTAQLPQEPQYDGSDWITILRESKETMRRLDASKWSSSQTPIDGAS